MIDGQLTFLRRQDDAKKIGSPIKGVSNLARGPFSRPVPKRRGKGLVDKNGGVSRSIWIKDIEIIHWFSKKNTFHLLRFYQNQNLNQSQQRHSLFPELNSCLSSFYPKGYL